MTGMGCMQTWHMQERVAILVGTSSVQRGSKKLCGSCEVNNFLRKTVEEIRRL